MNNSNLAETLSSGEIDVVKRSLQAAVEGDFFPEWEFETLIGVDREAVRTVYVDWPRRTVGEEEFSCAIVGSMANLIGYPHGEDDALLRYVPEGRVGIQKALDRLDALGL